MSGRERLRFRREPSGSSGSRPAGTCFLYLTAAENVEMPMALRRARAARSAGRGRPSCSTSWAWADRAGRRPAEMSGGEQQRVAIAVALANRAQRSSLPTSRPASSTRRPAGGLRRPAPRQPRTGRDHGHRHPRPGRGRHVDRTVGIRDGRTSSEILRRTTLDADGSEEIVAAEYAVLDRAGRLQLPREFTSALEMKDRVRLALETDHIGVWPDRSHDDHREDLRPGRTGPVTSKSTRSRT